MEILLHTHEIPPDLVEFFEPVDPNAARDVFTVATQPYSGAHFATFPPALIEPCILAGSASKACEHCGAAWVRVTEQARGFTDGRCNGCGEPRNKHVISDKNRGKNGFGLGRSATMLDDGAVPCGARNTTGWEQSCECADNTGTARSVVLDPFSGAGTTAMVADRLGRDAISIELNPSYAAMATDRVRDDCPLFADVVQSPYDKTGTGQ
jgi:hypothetical protein